MIVNEYVAMMKFGAKMLRMN